MEFKKFNFDPPGGFRDSGYYEDTPEDARDVLQRQHDQTRDYINGIADILNSSKEGESGSEYISSPKIDGVEGENVFSQIKSIKRQLVDASAGSINDGSITSVKLASGCVTGDKIAGGSVKSEHFSKDAECPFAKDTKNVNGIPANQYQPVRYTAGFNLFKERVSDFKMRSLYGKNCGDYRYFTDADGKIRRFSFSDFSVSEVVDFSVISPERVVYDTDENGDLYIGYIDFSDAKFVYINFFKHEKNETYPVKRIKLAPTTNTSQQLDDIMILGDDLYALYTVSVTSGYFMAYLYKYSLTDLEDTDNSVYVFSDKMYTKKIIGKLFVANGDMFFHNYRIKNMDFESFEILPWYFLGESGGNFYVYHNNYVIVDENMLPSMARTGYSTENGYSSNSFIRGDYIYMNLADYLFRSKII